MKVQFTAPKLWLNVFCKIRNLVCVNDEVKSRVHHCIVVVNIVSPGEKHSHFCNGVFFSKTVGQPVLIVSAGA